MAAKEIYDYLDTVAADYDYALNVTPQKSMIEEVDKHQDVHYFDDGSNRVISDDDVIASLTLTWETGISESDAGIILDFYADTAKANARAKSFKFDNPEDGHTYVVKFTGPLKRVYKAGKAAAGIIEVPTLVLDVIGKIVDA